MPRTVRQVSPPPLLEGQITPPGDKSISHRAAIFNSLAGGQVTLSNFLLGEDCVSTLKCLQALGVEVELRPHEATVVMRSPGAEGFREPEDVLDAGNSGTTMRLLAGALAPQPFLSIITGDASLRSRPMDRVLRPLRLMGAEIWGRSQNSLAPLVIRGRPLHGIEYSLPVASAQVKSALLIAGLFARGETRLHQPAASRDHTERMFKAMGASIEVQGLDISLKPGRLSPLDIKIPGDISAAAFWLVAGAVHPQARVRVCGVGVNPTRTGILDVLQQMGARLQRENPREEGGEPVADLVVESSRLSAVEVYGDTIPRLIDEIPVLALAACFARGTTVIRDARELRVKETDRIQTTAQELNRLGARIQELPDGLLIEGMGQLEGGLCCSRGDHRLAMTLGIAGLLARGPVVVEDAAVADVSYPGFWEHLERLKKGG